jgi:excisionase family DNA binding protein
MRRRWLPSEEKTAAPPGDATPDLAPHRREPISRAAIEIVREVLKDPMVREEIRAIVRADREAARLEVEISEPLIDAREAAKVLGMSAPAVRAAAFRGTLPSVHVGRLLRFRRSQLLAAIR